MNLRAPRKGVDSMGITLLGQSGCRLALPGGVVVYVDPYLSNSVQELDARDLERLIPVPCLPGEVRDADWVFITHAHIDHCDPWTLPELAAASPHARFLGPQPVVRALTGFGIARERILLASETWHELGPDARVQAVPAAHPVIERDADGNLAAVGYVLECKERRIYIAGDTSVDRQVIDALGMHRPIDVALLPVNEQNFFRERRGIIGNMSVREAFQLAEELGIRGVVPVHWDMFAQNSVSVEEILAVYKDMAPGFELLLRPQAI